jgi:hypothetical protein
VVINAASSLILLIADQILDANMTQFYEGITAPIKMAALTTITTFTTTTAIMTATAFLDGRHRRW